MKKTIQIIMLIVLTFVFLNPSKASGQFFFMENPNIGKEVQGFTLRLFNGEEISLDEFREGKKAIIFFWATWCPHCQVALAELNRKKDEIEGKDIKIALVNVGEAQQVVGGFLAKKKIDMDVFLDVDGEVFMSYGLVGVPVFYFIDEGGIVKDIQHSLPEDLDEVFSPS